MKWCVIVSITCTSLIPRLAIWCCPITAQFSSSRASVINSRNPGTNGGARKTPYSPPIGFQEIVRLGIPRLGTWRKQEQGFYEKAIWPPMALRIGLLRSSAPQNDGRIKPVILQCRGPQETNPKGHWGPNYFFIKSLFLLPPCTQSWYTQSYDP